MNLAIIKSKIESVFRGHPEVAAVYLFGSYAKGKNHFRSDLDLAIHFENYLSPRESYQKRESFFVELVKKTGLEADIIDLANINLILMQEILENNMLLVENNRYKNRVFIAKKILEVLDFQYTLNICLKGSYERSLERLNGKKNRTEQKGEQSLTKS